MKDLRLPLLPCKFHQYIFNHRLGKLLLQTSKNARKSFKKRLKCALLLVVLWVFATEIVSYWVWTFFWPSYRHVLSPDSVKILLVGDPQLLGYTNTWPNPFGFFARWDADRFIRKTHQLAYGYLEPELTIFLGDNFDEGESATDHEFDDYFERYKRVFSRTNFSQAIFLPGDNDIGGERHYPIETFEKRFNQYFRPEGFLQHKYIEFFKVNIMTQSKPYRRAFPRLKNIRILLSHIPLTPTIAPFARKVMLELDPHLIISAHEHVSYYLVVDPYRIELKKLLPNFSRAYKLQKLNCSDSNVHEIMVPSCSYRMGTEKIGFGALIIEPDGTMFYTVLWLPSRLKQLYAYIGLGIAILCVLFPAPIEFLVCHLRSFRITKAR